MPWNALASVLDSEVDECSGRADVVVLTSSCRSLPLPDSEVVSLVHFSVSVVIDYQAMIAHEATTQGPCWEPTSVWTCARQA